jgi:hypothetical protein
MTELSNPHKTMDLWKALTAIAVVGSTLAGAGWIAGRVYLQDEISQYKEAEKWKAPDAIRKISALSDNLSRQLDSIEDYELLKKYKIDSIIMFEALEKEKLVLQNTHENQSTLLKQQHDQSFNEIQEKNKKLDIIITNIKQQNQDFKDKIDSLLGDVVDVKVGQAQSVGHKSIRVGVTRTNIASNYASITSGEYENTITKVGDSFYRVVDSKKYVITLVIISEESCGFSYDVFENKEP